MHRRDVLSFLSAGAVASLLRPLSPSSRLELGRMAHRELIGSATPPSGDQALISRIAETILPRTDTPGALDVRVPEFVDFMMARWYSPEERDDFSRGLRAIEQKAGPKGFLTLGEPEQVALLTTLDGKKGSKGSAEESFATLKWLTVYGYVTSERVQKEVLKTQIMPGQFHGCVPFPIR